MNLKDSANYTNYTELHESTAQHWQPHPLPVNGIALYAQQTGLEYCSHSSRVLFGCRTSSESSARNTGNTGTGLEL